MKDHDDAWLDPYLRQEYTVNTKALISVCVAEYRNCRRNSVKDKWGALLAALMKVLPCNEAQLKTKVVGFAGWQRWWRTLRRPGQ